MTKHNNRSDITLIEKEKVIVKKKYNVSRYNIKKVESIS